MTTTLKGGPLNRATGDALSETDVIFTATSLGFAFTRALLRQPFTFDVANDAPVEDLRRTEALAKALVLILETAPAIGAGGAAPFIGAGRSPAHNQHDGYVVTGCPGGEHLVPADRNVRLSDEAAKVMAEWERLSAEPGGSQYQGQYHGRGAYTGIVDDPHTHHTLVVPSVRYLINDRSRWNPSPDGIWGLIGTNNNGGQATSGGKPSDNLSSDPSVGMGPLPAAKGIVQYTHGMLSAMREAIRFGPWITPHEIAVGAHTTKRASCFACTLYMWSAGFPASSSHIGSCESWGVLPDGLLGNYPGYDFSEGAEGDLDRAIARHLNIRWHAQMYHFLRVGSALLSSNPKLIHSGYQEAVKLLARFTENWDPTKALVGGNLFLDAITYHRKDFDRLATTLNVAAG